MSREKVRVLLLGESAKGSNCLLWYLQQRGCDCWCATSAEQGVALFRKYKFHLILGTSPIQQATRMISLMGRSTCSVFYAHSVEHGCWWLPLMDAGQECLGAPAFRPREFVGVLEATLNEVSPNYLVIPKRLQEIARDTQAFEIAS